MFEKATRQKLRFPFKGSITTEDLWDLTLPDLDSIYVSLSARKKETEADSLLKTRAVTAESKTLELQIEIVKHVFEVKSAEAEDRRLAKAKSEEKQKIMALIEQKKDAAMSEKSVEDLQKMLEAL